MILRLTWTAAVRSIGPLGCSPLLFASSSTGAWGASISSANAFEDGGGVIPKNPSGQSCAGAESFCELLPFANYLVDVGPNEFRKSHPSFPSERASRWDFLLDLDFNVTLTASDTALWMVGLTFLLPPRKATGHSLVLRLPFMAGVATRFLLN